MTFAVAERPASAEEDVRQYLQDIRQYPLLTADEERELALRCAAGDEEAIRTMVSSNLRLVVSVAREYAGRGVPLLDLIQEGSIGLLVAAKKFDPELGFRFSTYATKWIRRGVTRCLVEHGAMIRVPAHTADKLRKVLAARNALQQELGVMPEAAAIAQRSGFEPSAVEKLLELAPQVCSLDAPAGEDATLAALLEDMHAPQPEEKLVREELVSTMDALLSRLTERQRTVLRLHFGMEDGECHSLGDIAIRFGVSKERVRQIEQQAMASLKKMGAGFGLEDFLDE